MADPRAFPDRPFLAVSAAILRDGKVLIVRRARAPGAGIYTLPGGAVEAGETLEQAVIREIKEETMLDIAPLGFAGHREIIMRNAEGKAERHFVVLCFAARWIAGEPTPNDEISEARWRDPSELAGLKTTEGLAEIVAAAVKLFPSR
ncbi:MAG: NUDIX hydrolase [Pseudolabrys sp.]|nr:NUDIX hydrolase [Pseudolabrys sp.]